MSRYSRRKRNKHSLTDVKREGLSVQPDVVRCIQSNPRSIGTRSLTHFATRHFRVSTFSFRFCKNCREHLAKRTVVEAAGADFKAQDLDRPTVCCNILLKRLISCSLVLVSETHVEIIRAREFKQENTTSFLIENNDVRTAACRSKLRGEHVVLTG